MWVSKFLSLPNVALEKVLWETDPDISFRNLKNTKIFDGEGSLVNLNFYYIFKCIKSNASNLKIKKFSNLEGGSASLFVDSDALQRIRYSGRNNPSYK